MSPISSKKRVPPSASSKSPFFCLMAEVNDPFSCPNSSLSINSEGMAAQFTSMKGPLPRVLSSCNCLATSSLPVPFSPVMSTLALVGATLAIMSLTSNMGADSPIIWFWIFTAFFKTLFSVVRFFLSRALRRVMSRRFRSGGLGMKSKAPFLMASTAVSMVPWPESMMTGTSDSFRMASRVSMPSISGILMSQKMASKSCSLICCKASMPVEASAT